ncbi:hypothetical protein PIB30_034309 [Stylosanthes scabra]|uniref:Heat shock protein 90 n=1 Tax=Stylosanthes scabra TaxID=79078 RepID=A0ABU6RD38_9FABA|nr:hypothetical protein [Stylosanthes scabra]
MQRCAPMPAVSRMVSLTSIIALTFMCCSFAPLTKNEIEHVLTSVVDKFSWKFKVTTTNQAIEALGMDLSLTLSLAMSICLTWMDLNGDIGMKRQDLVDCLGTIAQSGTAKFLKALKDSKDAGGDNNLIGQFGVGFYSAFLVADKVTVSTKSPKSYKQYVWEGEANASSHTIREETYPEKLIPRGTRLTLHLKRDDKGFAHPERIEKLDYEKFWENFGKHLKLGCIEDCEDHKHIAPLLRFFSSQSEEELISLDEYVENMKPDQKDIYYIAADSVNSAKNTPFLERLAEKDLEVLFLVDPIDEQDLDLGDKNEEREKEMKQEFGQTCDWIKKHLGDKVASVQISNRLSSSPCVLVSGKFGWSANMERLMKAQSMGDASSLDFMRSRRVFEINPDHPIIRNIDV